MESGAQPGNENAKKGKEFKQALRRALARRAGTASKGLEEIAEKLVAAAYDSQQWAIIEIANREDGKPAQAIVGDSEEDPMSVLTEIVIRGIRAGPT